MCFKGGADGDCLFHVSAESLNFDLIYKHNIPTMICTLENNVF